MEYEVKFTPYGMFVKIDELNTLVLHTTIWDDGSFDYVVIYDMVNGEYHVAGWNFDNIVSAMCFFIAELHSGSHKLVREKDGSIRHSIANVK